MTERVGRRGLLRGLGVSSEREARPERAGFSLESFYARRAVTSSSELPPVVVEVDLPAIETSRVGVCPPVEHLVLPDLDEPEGVS
jgi:hypothetical protein